MCIGIMPTSVGHKKQGEEKQNNQPRRMRRPTIKATLLECIEWSRDKSDAEIIDAVDRWVDEFEKRQKGEI